MVNISINSSGVATGVNGFQTGMNQVRNIATQTARESALSFNSIFGANFFADLASNAVRSMTSGFTRIVADAVNAASQVESAFRGAESIGRNLGIDPKEVSSAIRNLDLVKSGLLNVGDAATALKNLLATGFSLDKSIELIKRFGDTAAFGRQSALSFGYAISSATEGIKNQNSILVDNAGVTKNLSVILRERGFEIQDLSDKVKGAAAREALYKGLLKETSLQLGDSNTLLNTTQGRMLQLDAAQQRLLQSLGRIITDSKLAASGIGALASVLDFLAKNTELVVGLTIAIVALTVAMIAVNTQAIPGMISGLTTLVTSLESTVAIMLGLGTAAQGAAATAVIFTAGWAAVIAILGAVVYATYNAINATKEIKEVSQQQIETTLKQVDTLKIQRNELDRLNGGNANLIAVQKTLSDSYSLLTVDGQRRVDLLDTEAQKTAQLKKEIQDLLAAKNEDLQIYARTNAAALASKAIEIQASEDFKKRIKERIALAEEFKQRLESGTGDVDRGDLLKIGQSLPTINDRQGRLNTVNEGLLSLNNAFTEASEGAKKLRTETDPLIAKQNALNKELGITTNTALDSANAHNLLTGNVTDAKNAVGLLGNQMSVATKQTNTQTDAIQNQIDSYLQLTDLLARSPARRKIIQDFSNQTAEALTTLGATTDKQAKAFTESLIAINPELKNVIETEKNFKKIQKIVDDVTGEKTIKTPKPKKTFSENLADGVEKLNKEVASFRDLTSKDFRIRFQREELERVKRDFEKIIDLRRELALPIDAQLPATAEGARKEIESLEQIKRLRDDILKIRNEERDAQERLVVAQIAANEAVVSAETRATTAILERIRERANAEAQLTADIIVEISKREDRQMDSIRAQATAEAESYRDFLKERNDQDEAQLKKIARLQLLAGQSFADNPLIKSLTDLKGEAQKNPVVNKLDTTNDLLQKILTAVDRSGNTGAVFTNGSPMSLGAKNSQGSALIKAAGMLGVSPVDLAALIGYETSGTYSPTIRGGKGNNYRGLIQFGPEEFQKYRVGKNQTFESQLINSVVPFLQDRFGGVGRSTEGATLLDLYKAVNGGNPNVSSNASDGFSIVNGRRVRNTIAGHVAKISSQHIPIALRRFFTALQTTQPTNAQTTAATTNAPIDNLLGSVEVTGGALATRPRVNPLPDLAKLFGLGDSSRDSLKTLSEESTDALVKYLDAKERFDKQTKADIIGQDRLNQVENVNITQKKELLVSEDRLARLRAGDALSATEALNDAEIARNRESASTLTQIIQKEDYLKKLRSGALDPELAEKRKNARLDEVTSLETEIKNLEERRSRGGRDAEIEELQLKRERLSVINSVGEAEAALEQQRKLNADQEFVQARRSADVITERTDLERRLASIEDERATGDINQALRVRLATEEALLDIHRQDLKAQEDIARSQVELADQTVYHADRANAAVLKYLAGQNSITDAISNAKIGVIQTTYDFIDRGLTKLTSKLGVAGDVIKDLLSSIIKLTLNKVFLRLLGLDTAGNTPNSITAGTTGGGAGSFVGNILSSVFNPSSASSGGFGGSMPGFNPSGGLFTPSSFNFRTGLPISPSGGGGADFRSTFLRDILTPSATSISDTTTAPGTRPRIVGGAAQSAGSSILSSIFGKGFSLKGLGSAVGSIAPLLGLSLGGSLGGSSASGQILGSAGGLLAGGVLSALIGGSLTGATTGGVFGSIGGLLGISAGATAGIALAAAPLLLLGSYFLGRNKKRRQEEVQRTQILTDAKSKIQDLIDQVRGGRLDSASAIAQATTIRSQYLTEVGKLTDKKTRGIAVATVREIDAMIEQLRTAGNEADVAAERFKLLVPTFATSGNIDYVIGAQGFAPRNSAERVVIAKRDDEVVLNQSQVAALGGSSAMSRAGVPGYTGSGSSGTSLRARSVSFTSSGSGSAVDERDQLFVLVGDEDTANRIVDKASDKYIAKKMRIHIKKTGLDGVAGDIAQEWNR